MKARALHASWVAGARRRIIARELRAKGWTLQAIANELGVSREQVRRDCLPLRVPR